MNYKESQLILDEIKKAKKILLNCHRGPDSDTVGSALAMEKVLVQMGKEVLIICPSDIPDDLKFLSGSNKITKTDFRAFDFGNFDLFIIMDSSNYGLVANSKDIKPPSIKKVIIDHHRTNEGFGEVNLVDSKATSTAEVLFDIFEDWKIVLDGEISKCLLTGIIGDTGCFQYKNVGKKTLKVSSELIDNGANKDEIIFNLYRKIDFKTVKFWGKVIEFMNKDDDYKFVWSALPLKLYKEYGEDPSAKEDGANLFFPIVEDTNFGVIMVETAENSLSISLRARENFDVSQIAEEIGGGGHIAAAGARIEGIDFEKAVQIVLDACRKYAIKKN